jgi:proline dehydrogenase
VALYDRAIVRLLPAVPKPVVQRLSARYIAGDSLSDAARVVRRLNDEGKRATVDVLGEEIRSTAEARSFADAYEEVLAEIERGSLDSTVSVKLTALGLDVDPDVCRANLEEVVRDAASRSNDVTIDMEDSSTTDATLALYRALREAGHDNVGIVLQAALRRTAADVAAVADLRPTVRLCKGIYVEPESIAYREYEAIRASFVRALEGLLEAGCFVGIATHDEWLLDQARRIVAESGLGRDRYEFQMLLGVRQDLGDELVADGHALRVYVPFGEHWYAYSLRRLQENPKLAGYIASDVIARVLPRRRRATAAPPG